MQWGKGLGVTMDLLDVRLCVPDGTRGDLIDGISDEGTAPCIVGVGGVGMAEEELLCGEQQGQRREE